MVRLRYQTGTRQVPDRSQRTTTTEKQEEVLDLIRKNPKITRKEIASVLKISEGASKKFVDALKKKGIIQRIGGDFGGYWEILKK